MTYQPGCQGRVVVGALPESVQRTLVSLPGDWLEYDPPSGSIVVRHIQPTDDPVLPAVTVELVRILSVLPFESLAEIEGGDLFVHTEETGRLVRLRVEPGGALHIQWARPGYAGAQKRAWSDGHEVRHEPWNHRLNGEVVFGTADPASAAASLQELADTYEGLHPEGEFEAVAEGPEVRVTLREVNLDGKLFVEALHRLAGPRTLDGRVDVASFREMAPEQLVRVLFEKGKTWVQHPMLWT
ncbi:MAG: hypothetical protein M8857_03280 [marine benthic group bacterium]|nr:hypothetical protein [Gemmatimonadota bacterium]MCL7968349.1 hypothetical protein [Gemmatimonadota bacterium]MCL7983606.1 hypothetical protein [Gemmatimonadota bacterium]